MLGLLSLFSLDFLALECLNEGADAYYNTVYLWCVLPIALSIFIILVGIGRYYLEKSASIVIRRANRTQIVNDHFYLFLILTYLVLPPVSSKQLQIFDCISLDSGESYIRSDTSIDCNSSSYIQFRYVVLMFIGLYQMIPVLWFILLYRERFALNPPTSAQDKSVALFIRDNNPDLAPIQFLFIDYRCSKWWFEIADMYRRIIFIGILPLISPRPAIRSSFGCVLAILSVAYFREEQPYRVDFTNVIAHMAQFSILITFYSALSIASGAVVNFGLEGYRLGVFLIILNLVVLILSFWFAWSRFRKQHDEQIFKEFKAKHSEDATNFTELEFKNVFESIWLHSVPTSHALVFHYSASENAKTARKSGLPAESRFNGVPFTLRHPHAVTKNDHAAFNNFDVNDSVQKFPNEEVLVLSLPREFLEPLTGFEDDPSICMVPASILSAMRPSSFRDVVDEKPWKDGILMLPPHCILRSFVLTNGGNKRGSKLSYMTDMPKKGDIEVMKVFSAVDYLEFMHRIRQKAYKEDLVPLYHYTSLSVLPLILKNGLRMGSQLKGDGGVYVTTQGPASYGIGSDRYELNIIKDCFGVDRLYEYENQGKLDVVIVYGCNPNMIHPVVGESKYSHTIENSNFLAFSMPNKEQNYFLRSDRILGVFQVDRFRQPIVTDGALVELDIEKSRDITVADRLHEMDSKRMTNAFRIERSVESIWGSFARGSLHANQDLLKKRVSSSILTDITPPLQSITSTVKSFRDRGQQIRDTEGGGHIEMDLMFSGGIDQATREVLNNSTMKSSFRSDDSSKDSIVLNSASETF